MSPSTLIHVIVLSTLGLVASSPGQTLAPSAPPAPDWLSGSSHVVVPQAHAFSVPQAHVFSSVAAVGRPAPSSLEITEVIAGVVIVEQAATTTLDISLRNTAGARVQAELLVPVPDGAAVRGFAFQGSAAEPVARLLTADEAKTTYRSLVAKIRDPALLEFAGLNLIRSSVFPIEANGTQKVRLTYEHLLEVDGQRLDYVLPRSESLLVQVPWQINVRISSKRAVSTVYSPSHQVETVRSAPGELSVRLAEQARTDPGSFRLSCLLDDGPLSASLLAYPDAKAGGGTFLLLTGLGNAATSAPAAATQPAAVLNRELTIVLDRSGSMQGEKIVQVRNAALQILAGLGEGDWFNLITYNDQATPLYAAPQPWSTTAIEQAKACLAGVTAGGGTNIHDALVEALRPPVQSGRIPLVLFLTDGLPTVGVTSETDIRDAAARANTSQRRVFTFGVGFDVNVPLLERIASQSRGTATFVQPREDVEVKVSQVFSKLAGPRLANLRLEVVGPDGTSAAGRVSDLLPEALPDLYEGDQLVLLGHYRGEQPLSFRITGQSAGGPRTFQFTFAMDKATTRNAFVPRLWASRRVGQLVDLIRQSGAATANSATAMTPASRELVDEVVRLSSEYGILTEYTAFLALEGTDLSKRDAVLATAGQNFAQRGMAVRTGAGAFNQAFNTNFMVQQAALNGRNRYQNENLQSVEVNGIQQMNDRAFYHRSGRWVDGRLVQKTDPAAGARVVEFGSAEYDRLAGRMAAEHRAGVIALRGEILTEVDDQAVLIKGP